MLGLPLAHAWVRMAHIEMLMQAVASTRDTLIMKQVVPERGLLEQITAICTLIITVSLTVLAIFAVPAAYRFRGTYKKVNDLLERVQNDFAPIMQHASQIADNVNYVTSAIRADVAKVQNTINSANERVNQAVELTEQRLNEFNALLAVIQTEAEQAFVSTASTLRGFRSGAAAFRDRSGMDFASDDLDSAALADDFEGQSEREEEIDGDDGNPESSTAALSAAPRIRPRTRGRYGREFGA